MAKRGTYLGGSTQVNPGSDWFSKGKQISRTPKQQLDFEKKQSEREDAQRQKEEASYELRKKRRQEALSDIKSTSTDPKKRERALEVRERAQARNSGETGREIERKRMSQVTVERKESRKFGP